MRGATAEPGVLSRLSNHRPMPGVCAEDCMKIMELYTNHQTFKRLRMDVDGEYSTWKNMPSVNVSPPPRASCRVRVQ